METKKIKSKEDFKKIFDRCMQQKEIYFESGKEKVKPVCTIRDFKIENYPECDIDFKENEFEQAYKEFVRCNGYCRVMDVAGYILADYYHSEKVD